MTVAIILAAGKGTRMRSHMAKVAHRIGGRPLIAHVHTAVSALGDVTPLYVLGHLHESVRELLPAETGVVLQEDQRGTGHAVRIAMDAVAPECAEVLVLYGDMPLITPETLQALRARHAERGARLTVLSAEVAAPHGYGRIVRAVDGTPLAVIEEKELTAEQRAITEINTGVYAIDAAWLRQALRDLPEHADGEYYLTDLVAQAAQQRGLEVLPDALADEVLGVNDRRQLAQAERLLRMRVNSTLMDAGVTLIDPASAYIAADATIGMDTIIEPQVWIGEGVTIGEGCYIGSHSRIVASAIGDRCVIMASVIEYAQVEQGVSIGPFSHLRVGAMLDTGVHVGNFAEIKNSSIGDGAKVPHFSYVGDATVGRRVNIGAGSVTANYDGRQKHHSTIGDDAFIGSGTILRAPVNIGAGGITGAGSVVTHDVGD
ncbi:MAG TPA: bifunctional UDP-N-acetylglucosamine diphosphorylase/glucosamine-1-phosphate N-acetyltransferase GlmU, partial [Chloroflexota bacterium]|nr:bifunctional UDP-N-acetylglucosamine diphosphorylase/glucosamine-1-phosphate N-acetyltransferase GlmU [Chloroflexota bacterium]